MKIRVAILDKDSGYLKRIVSVFHTKYSEKLEIYSFTNYDMAIGVLESEKIDIFLANASWRVESASLPKRCGFAYLVDSSDIETLRNEKVICKFQKVDLIYKQILDIYSDYSGHISGIHSDGDGGKVVLFASPSGGSGSSTMAAAFALQSARLGKQVLYLNLERFGSADVFFSGDGQFDLSDVIAALKSRKANFAIKLESCIKQDPRGVRFLSQTKVALDRMEMSMEEITRLITALRYSSSNEYLIVDIDFCIDAEMIDLYKIAHAIVMTGDGSEISNRKITRAWESFSIIEQNTDTSILNKISLVYNRFNSHTCRVLQLDGLRVIGRAPRYKGIAAERLAEELAGMEMLDHILD